MLLSLLLLIAVALVLLRSAAVIKWPWQYVFAPFIVGGAFLLSQNTLRILRNWFDEIRGLTSMMRDNSATGSLPPEELEAPLCSDDPGDRILAQHPELLAAICLGFRMKRLQPTILDKPITDPWGVYSRALTASSLEFDQVRHLAKKHARAFAELGNRKIRKAPSDALVMSKAVEAFRRCAERTTTKGGNPDCPFEHVTVVYGLRIPSRDATLKSIAPRVRALLERQYPQLATATLADGSHLKFEKWQQQAADARQTVARVQREGERLSRKLESTATQLSAARTQVDELREEVDRTRRDAQARARTEQLQVVNDLRQNIERNTLDHNREVQRMSGDLAKQMAIIEALTAERDELERMLLSAEDVPDSNNELEGLSTTELAGLRVLLVGGDSRMVVPIREFTESYGVQLVHDDTMNAAQLVAGVDLVIFWIRYLQHPKYYGVRRECRVRGTTHGYWMRTSNASLIALIAKSYTAVQRKAAAQDK